MNHAYRFLGLIFIFVLTLNTANAMTSTFRVSTLIDPSTTPPSAPTNLVAIPVATSQINLSWATSTGAPTPSGYQVFRDGVQIATTTLPGYDDAGLTGSTTYTYYVRAFDIYMNISDASPSVSTTTFPELPPSTTSATMVGSMSTTLTLSSIQVLPTQDQVLFQYDTSGYAQGIIRWGRTSSYELGSLAERLFMNRHQTTIVGLLPDTVYFYEITGIGNRGEKIVLFRGTFRTQSTNATTPPGNIQDLRAVIDGNDIILSWKNPNDPNLDKIRFVRSDRFYPGDPNDGWVTYEGTGETTRDAGAAISGTTQYYTAFSYDRSGNISSGAVIAVAIRGANGTPVAPPFDNTKNTLSLSFSDLQFYQDGIRISHDDYSVPVDGSKRLTIALPYSRVPEHLKTILVTLVNSAEPSQQFSFLLRINRDKTGYTATLAPLGVNGMFPLRVSVFDYNTEQVGYISGSIDSSIVYTPPPSPGFIGTLTQMTIDTLTSYYLWFMLFLLLIAIRTRRLIHHQH